jgi:putative methyltransferase
VRQPDAAFVEHSLSYASLLDPSCSGSGIVNRLDHLLENGTMELQVVRSCLTFPPFPLDNQAEEGTDGRLNKLATFQVNMIQHAMKCR